MKSISLQSGMFIKATDLLKDTLFESAEIFISEYNEQGASGFIINKPFGRSLHELEEFKRSIYFPLYHGGPVNNEHLFVLHQRPDLIAGSRSVVEGIFFGGDFKDVVTAINRRSLQATEVKIFVGYCGWDAGELENEIEEGSWQIVQHAYGFVFTSFLQDDNQATII